LLKPHLPGAINSNSISMSYSVQFNNQLRSRTEEIDDETPDRMLPTELETGEPSTAECFPKQCFR
jgi:hypothetical protein